MIYQVMYNATNLYRVNDDTVHIRKISAGEGTADNVIVWSDGYVETTVGGDQSPRERYLQTNGNMVSGGNWTVTFNVSDSVEYSPPPKLTQREKERPAKPWKLDLKPPKRPRFVPRPEFHARSNPRGR